MTRQAVDPVRYARDLLLAKRLDESERILSTVPPGQNAAQVAALRGMLAAGRQDGTTAMALFEESLAIEPTFDAAICLARLRHAARDSRDVSTPLATAFRLMPESTAARNLHRLVAPPERAPSRPPVSRGGLQRPLSIWFNQTSAVPYDGNTPRHQPLGGTESAVVYLAEALAEAGHTVRVYNGCEGAQCIRGVEYRGSRHVRADAMETPPDVLVSIRDWSLMGGNRFAPLQLLWTGDAPDQASARGLELPEHRAAIDYFVFQSQWQEDAFRTALHIDPWRIARTKLGFAPVTRRDNPGPRLPRLIYASTPFRGLDLLLDWFPLIRQRCPDAELRVCSSMRVYGVSEAEDRARFGALYDRARQPGIVVLGSLPQPTLADEYGQARVLAYPNHWPETFCITVVEAQASGCPVVTSRLGALPETVGDGGVCIPGDPRSDPSFRDTFVDEVVTLLTNADQWRSASRAARSRAARDYTWSAVAAEWSRFCYAALAGDAPAVERIAQHLSSGHYSLARRIMEREGPPEAMAPEEWTALGELVGWLDASTEPPSPDQMTLVQRLGPVRRLPAFDAWSRQVA